MRAPWKDGRGRDASRDGDRDGRRDSESLDGDRERGYDRERGGGASDGVAPSQPSVSKRWADRNKQQDAAGAVASTDEARDGGRRETRGSRERDDGTEGGVPQAVYSAFQHFDLDGNGTLDTRELRNALRHYGYAPARAKPAAVRPVLVPRCPRRRPRMVLHGQPIARAPSRVCGATMTAGVLRRRTASM